MQDNCSVYPYTSGADLEPSLDPALQMFIILINGGLGFFLDDFHHGSHQLLRTHLQEEDVRVRLPVLGHRGGLDAGHGVGHLDPNHLHQESARCRGIACSGTVEIDGLLLHLCANVNTGFFSSVEYWTFVLLE